MQQIKDGKDFREYVEQKYKGQLITDASLNKEIEVKDIGDLRLEDLELEDQRIALSPHVGWGWGVADKADITKANHIKGYLFRPRQRLFFYSSCRYPAYIGAFGSGKSLILWLKAIQNSLAFPGTRGVYMRATYPQLEKASLPTLWKIFNHFGWRQGHEYEHNVGKHLVKLRVGKDQFSEILYMPAKNEGTTMDQAIQDLRSLEIDYACADEIADIDEQIFMALGDRIGRWGRIPLESYQQLMVAGNPPSEGSWIHKRWYKHQENNGKPLKNPKSHSIWVSSTYENKRNLPTSYIKSLESRPEWYKRAYLYGDLGFQPPDGTPVFGNFDYGMYVRDKVEVHEELPIIRGWDLGPTAKNKACVIGQVDPRGVLLILGEVLQEDIGIGTFVQEVVRQTNLLFPQIKEVKDFTDPVAFHASQTDGKSAADIARENGVNFFPGEERTELRLDAVRQVMSRIMDGESPGMLINKSLCPKIIQGFMGGYRYKVVDNEHKRFSMKPVKDEFSHCLHPDTLISCPEGNKRIADIEPGDYVKTPNGNRQVSATMNQEFVGNVVTITLSNGTKLKCTDNHPIYTSQGLQRADSLCYNSSIITSHNYGDYTWEDPQFTRYRPLKESNFIGNQKDIISQMADCMVENICTDMFGNTTMERFPRTITSTIKTVIRLITTLRILSSSQLQGTLHITPQRTIEKFQTEWAEVSLLQEKQPKNGTHRKKGESGTANTEKRFGKNKRKKNLFAQDAVNNTRLIDKEVVVGDSVLHTVRQKPENSQGLMTKLSPALSATKPTASTSTQKEKPALKIVELSTRKETMRVYDLTVEHDHCFFAENVLVGNCMDALQYLCSRLGFVNNKKRDEYRKKISVRNRDLVKKRRRLSRVA